jgi:hypothetical protein
MRKTKGGRTLAAQLRALEAIAGLKRMNDKESRECNGGSWAPPIETIGGSSGSIMIKGTGAIAVSGLGA